LTIQSSPNWSKALENEHNVSIAKRAAITDASAEIDEQLFDEIYGWLDLAQSYIVSALEASRRYDRHELKIRQSQINDCLKYTFEALTLLGEARK
jgi:hypothetical protein